MPDTITYDYLIIGGGSAGSVMASRLSEMEGKTVCLVEVGRDLSEANMPAQVASPYPGRAYFDRSLTWEGLRARLSENPSAPEIPYEQGRGLGGTSLINGIGSNRGSPQDYREWHDAGAAGWDWPDVLPYFRRLESDAGEGAESGLHGTSGPWPVRRIPRESFTGFTRAVHGALESRQFRAGTDQNGPWRDGIFPTSVNLDEHGRRASAATTYLRPAVRARRNLTILCDTRALRLMVSDGVAQGAELLGPRGPFTLRAREVIVCTGALHTPALLMRSGIGPAAELAGLGIAPIADLPGVGGNLMEHPSIGVTALIARGARMAPGDHYHIQSVLRWSSNRPDTPVGDMHTAIVARAGWHSIGNQMASLFSWVNKSYSTGRVRLRSDDPMSEPEVRFDMLSDPRDLERLGMALRQSASVLTDPALAGTVLAALPSSYSPRIKKFLAPTWRNGVLTAIAAPLVDHVPAMRRLVLKQAQGDAPSLEHLMRDDAALEAYLKANVGGVWHPCGTARMGRADDPMAVTTSDGRVRGLSGLRVCDASLMPTIPCANINVPVLMIAEKISDDIKAAAGMEAKIAC